MRLKNFSLIDLVVVLVLITILGTVIIWQAQKLKTNVLVNCLGDMKQIGTAIAIYSSDSSYGVMPDKGPKARIYQTDLISDPKIFKCKATPFHKMYERTTVKGGVTHKKGEPYCDYKRTGQGWSPELGWADGWAQKYKPNVVICGDGVLNHGGEAAALLFKDGHGYIHRFAKTVTEKNFATTHVDNIKGTYSKNDRMYKYDEAFDTTIHDGTWPKFETNTMLLFSEEDGADSPTLKDASPF